MSSTPNLVTLISQFITPEMLNRSASALGVDLSSMQKGVSAGIPGILAALTSSVMKPGGIAKIENAIDQQQPGVLADTARMMGTPQQARVADEGLNSLSSVLGGGTMSALANAVGRYSGAGETGAKGMLGLLAPVVMGVLGQQQNAGAGGVAQLLASQKDNVMRAMPPEFANYLGSAGILDKAAQTTTSGAQHRSSYQSANYSTDKGTSQGSWLLPALAALCLLGLGWYLFSRPSDTTVATAPTEVQSRGVAPESTRVTDTTRFGGAPFVVAWSDLDNWLHKSVYSSDNKKVGEIAELIRDPEDRVTNVYMDAETTLGLGGQRYDISADKISEVKPNDGIVLSMTEAEIKAMPPADGAKADIKK